MGGEGAVLVLTASAGAGHVVAASAIVEALRERLAGRRVEAVDVLKCSTRLFRGLYAQGYLAAVNHLPALMGYLYDVTDRPCDGLASRLRSAYQDLSNRALMRRLLRDPPALVINTHFLPAELIARLRRAGRLDVPQFVVTTDFETHQIWIQEPTERYFTATGRGKAYLCARGVEAERVCVSGIPVRRGFEKPADRRAIRLREGLDCERPVVLLLCGGFGVGPTRRLFEQLLAVEVEHQLVAVAGRNEDLRADLERCAQRAGCAASGAGRPCVRVLGYVENMHEWMAAADVLVSKPGGLTASEALVSGLPMLVVNPIPGPESRNCDYLLEHGAAVKVNAAGPAAARCWPLLSHAVGELLRDRGRLEAMRAAARAIARPGAADAVAEAACRLLDARGAARPAALSDGASRLDRRT